MKKSLKDDKCYSVVRNRMKKKIIIVTGPTAVGKTDFVINMANELNTEIVSADSMQIYKKLDIGSAKPTKEEIARAKHHLIDFVEPSETYSVYDYKMDAIKVIEDMHERDMIPIISGGTGLYLHSLIYDMDFEGAENRDKSRNEYDKLSLDKLRKMLEDRGIELTNDDLNNKRRLTRKLEIYESTGKKTEFKKSEYKEGIFDTEIIVLNRDRQELYDRINLRVDIMMEKGLLDEVKSLMDMGLTKEHQSMKGIGYKELISHLEGEISLDEAIELIKRNSRRYAKRQITWFKRYKNARFIEL